MKHLYKERPNGYQESIKKGLSAVRYFSRNMSFGTGSKEERISRLKNEIQTADVIVIGAGAGLSTSAGLTYSGARFDSYFLILQESMVFGIFIPVASIRFQIRKLAGHGGQGTSITIDMLMRRNLFIRSYFHLWRIRIILLSLRM